MTDLAAAWVASQLGPHTPGEERLLGVRLPRLAGVRQRDEQLSMFELEVLCG